MIETNSMTNRPVFDKTLIRANRSMTFLVRKTWDGWESIKRVDREVVKRQRLADWHRVERTVAGFAYEIAELRRGNWTEVQHAG